MLAVVNVLRYVQSRMLADVCSHKRFISGECELQGAALTLSEFLASTDPRVCVGISESENNIDGLPLGQQ